MKAWLQLVHTPGLGPKTAQKLLAKFQSAEQILLAKHSDFMGLGLKSDLVAALVNHDVSLLERDLQWLAASDSHHIICPDDELFPERLRELDDTPLVLYLRGDPDYLLQPQLAMVGSRNPTAVAAKTAHDFAKHLSSAGVTITSGLANGIDGASHQGALQGIAGTVAVVAHGLDIVYPANHQQLAQQIEEAGVVVSEVPIGTEPTRGQFPRRNRIISGLSIGTLVVEAALKSGSLITARLAMEQNKEVFAIPGSIHNPLARGCHKLIRDGAKLVETAADILEDLSVHFQSQDKKVEKQDAICDKNAKYQQVGIDSDHQKLLKCLQYDPIGIDQLVHESDFSAAEIASMLLILELQGTVVAKNGRYSCVDAEALALDKS